MTNKMTPEERLLALIKGKRKKEGEIPKEAPGAPIMDSQPEPDVRPPKPKRRDYLADLLKAPIFRNKFFNPHNLKTLNLYLIYAIAIIAVYLIIELIFVNPYRSVESVLTASYADHTYKPAIKPAREELNYSHYENVASGRNVFGPGAGDTAVLRQAASEDISSSLGLVGIIPGDNPQAIIENKKTQKVYYVAKGGAFENFIVEEISENKVVVDYGGKKIEMFL